MAKDKPGTLQVKRFADHHVITQPNPLGKVLLRVHESDLDDPVARAEKALADLSGEFKTWMTIEADRLSAAHAAVLRHGFTDDITEELFRAAHDIKGDAATFGFPSAAAAAESLCRIIEHAPELEEVPPDLITHHIDAVQAIVRERTKLDTVVMANALSRQLRGVADEFLIRVICGRPPWHKSFVRFDRIACVHMSGLLVQLVRPLAKMVSATRVPINRAALLGRWVPRTCSYLGSIDRTISSALAAPVRPVG